MISFKLAGDWEIIRSTLRNIAQDILAPRARRHDRDKVIGAEPLDTAWQAGIVQAQADRETSSPFNSVIVPEKLAASDANAALAVAGANGFVQAIADQGSEAQRPELLTSLNSKSFPTWTIAAMEPDFAGDVTRPATRAAAENNGYVLNGRETMVPMAARSTHLLVIADLDGVSDAFILDASALGVTIEAHETLSLRGVGFGEVSFDQVELLASARLGEGNGANVRRVMDSARIDLAATMLGTARAVVEYLLPYTKERVLHGFPLAQKQKVAFDIADMRMRPAPCAG